MSPNAHSSWQLRVSLPSLSQLWIPQQCPDTLYRGTERFSQKHMPPERTATISVLCHTAQMVLCHLGGKQQQPGRPGGRSDEGCSIPLQASRLCRRLSSFPALPGHVSGFLPSTQSSLYSAGRHRVFVPLQQISDTGWCL